MNVGAVLDRGTRQSSVAQRCEDLFLGQGPGFAGGEFRVTLTDLRDERGRRDGDGGVAGAWKVDLRYDRRTTVSRSHGAAG
jgi:hypothetical protein